MIDTDVSHEFEAGLSSENHNIIKGKIYMIISTDIGKAFEII